MSALEYREQQVGMYREALREAHEEIATLKTQLAMALDRAEIAEDRNRVLREEIREARQTPFG